MIKIIKNVISFLFYYTWLSKIFFHISRFIYGNSHIRIVNYHSTPRAYNNLFRYHLDFYKKYYSPVKEVDLLNFLDTGKWLKEKPGIIISFDDGLRNNFTEALPIIEEFGFIGWFCIPASFHQMKHEEQNLFAQKNSIIINDEKCNEIAMSSDDLIKLSKNHVILSHTMTHKRLTAGLETKKLNQELIQSKNVLEKIINKKVYGFCWVGGEIDSYSKTAHEIIIKNYKYSFHTNNKPVLTDDNRFALNRSNIEVWFSNPIFLLTLCGFYDLMYLFKRQKIKDLLEI